MDSYDCIEVEKDETVSIVKLKDRRVMDSARIELLGRELSSVATNDDEMLLDLDNVKFISSAAISKLIVLERQMRAKGRKLRLRNLKPEVRDLFSLAKLDTIFEIEKDSESR